MTWNCKKKNYNQDIKMMNELLLIYKKPQKWNKSQSMEHYFKSIIFQTIEFIWFQGGTVKNSFCHIQDIHSKQEKVHWKGAKNYQNNFYFINRKKNEKKCHGLISKDKNNISKFNNGSRKMNDPCVFEFDRGFALIICIMIFIHDF